MRYVIALLPLLATAPAACGTAPDDRATPREIMGGTATITAYQLVRTDRTTVLADSTGTRTGALTVGSDGAVYGSIGIDGKQISVSGTIQVHDHGTYLDAPNLPPGSFLVLTDEHVFDRYQLLGTYVRSADLTGDGVAENFQDLYSLQKN
jgi:hypothetical protein